MKNICGGSVAVIGAGAVGSAIAYALLLSGAASKIVLLDANKNKAEGEALDLMHATQFTPGCFINAGTDLQLLADADIIILAAGANQKTGESRTDLLEKNVAIFKELIPQIIAVNKTCTFLVVTNPLDVMTYVTYKLSGFSSDRVFGSGTVLDSARLRFLISEHLTISPKDITAFILGEHGDSAFVWWSGASAGGVSLSEHPKLTPDLMMELHHKTVNAAATIIEKKGFTNYAIATVVVKIVKALLKKQERIFTLSTINSELVADQEICISLPGVIHRSGSYELLPITLNHEESLLLRASAEKIAADIKKALSFII